MKCIITQLVYKVKSKGAASKNPLLKNIRISQLLVYFLKFCAKNYRNGNEAIAMPKALSKKKSSAETHIVFGRLILPQVNETKDVMAEIVSAACLSVALVLVATYTFY